jgi:hypothetical protein
LLLFSLAVMAAGCGRGVHSMRVWGTVRHEGISVENGLVVFSPIDGTAGPATGAAITQGDYDIPARSGPRANGVYRVEITSYGPPQTDPSAPGAPAGIVRDQVLPPQFNRETMLRARISANADANRFDFDLENAPTDIKRSTTR